MKSVCVFGAMVRLCLAVTAADTASAPAASAADTNAQETLRAFLTLQEQLHANQLAIDAARTEADEAAARNAEALMQNAETLSARLKAIEDSLSKQRGEELRSIQSSSKMMLMVAGGFAVLGISAMVLMAFLQWRTVNRLAEITSTLPPMRAFAPAPEVRALGAGEDLPSKPVLDSNARLASVLDQLEKRILDLEARSRFALQSTDDSTGSNGIRAGHNGHDTVEPGSAEDLLASGQALLEKEQPEKAMELFEKAEELTPSNPDIFLRKGSALERLGKLEEAIKAFDHALELDGTVTIAYLHKGALLNRMEKFSEALGCYEKALRSQETVQS